MEKNRDKKAPKKTQKKITKKIQKKIQKKITKKIQKKITKVFDKKTFSENSKNPLCTLGQNKVDSHFGVASTDNEFFTLFLQ